MLIVLVVHLEQLLLRHLRTSAKVHKLVDQDGIDLIRRLNDVLLHDMRTSRLCVQFHSRVNVRALQAALDAATDRRHLETRFPLASRVTQDCLLLILYLIEDALLLADHRRRVQE
jgi:hypothetical protein